jgi:aerobic-type carbon monoxide dehydrogenase small subunit (CoxS/CutS family)
MNLEVNGQTYSLNIDIQTPLLWVLREQLHLTGTKFGCGIARCGVCTVLVDDLAVRSCSIPVGDVVGKKIQTIEGLAQGNRLHPVQEAWAEFKVPQCGYCQSGQICSAVALLKAKPNPTDSEIDQAMSGNLCRCGTYVRIKKAIKSAAGTL